MWPVWICTLLGEWLFTTTPPTSPPVQRSGEHAVMAGDRVTANAGAVASDFSRIRLRTLWLVPSSQSPSRQPRRKTATPVRESKTWGLHDRD